VNPPYGNGIGNWVEKAYRSAIVIGDREYCEHVVMLLPARTDTQWFHDYCLKASEIRFLRGRLCFGDDRAKRAPFPSMIVLSNGDPMTLTKHEISTLIRPLGVLQTNRSLAGLSALLL